jgi:DNA-directed RNA polymerase subunit alpha
MARDTDMMNIIELLNANELHMEQLLRARLSELGLAPNVLRILKGQGITTLRDLTSRSRADLLDIRFLGSENVDAIERLLKTMDLSLKHSQSQ